MTGVSISFTRKAFAGELEQAFTDLRKPLAEAAGRAIHDLGLLVKAEGRAELARAGFSKRWQNAWRTNEYPVRSKFTTLKPALFAFHRTSYAEVFEEGATITGKPLLWLPLAGAPRKLGRERMTPENFARAFGKLTYIGRGTQPPLLVAKAHLSRAQARRARPKVSLASLRRARDRGPAGRFVTRAVPIFIGVKRVTIPRKFDLRGVVRRGVVRLPQFYADHLRRLIGG